MLCEAQTTRPESQDKECCHWNENLEFQLKVCDIPRSAKLCYVLYSSRDSQAKKKRKGTQKEVRSELGDSVCQVEESVHVTTPLRAWPAAERCCTYILYCMYRPCCLYWWECSHLPMVQLRQRLQPCLLSTQAMARSSLHFGGTVVVVLGSGMPFLNELLCMVKLHICIYVYSACNFHCVHTRYLCPLCNSYRQNIRIAGY